MAFPGSLGLTDFQSSRHVCDTIATLLRHYRFEAEEIMGLTPREALDLFQSDDLIGIGMAAMEVRRKKNRSAHRDLSD